MISLRTHQYRLQSDRITLRPMTECDWDFLYRWYNDPEVLYYSEGDDVTGYSLNEIQEIYRGEDPLTRFCFIIEYAGQPIGACWLQRMNMEHLLRQFSHQDCRRIDLVIGEKDYWNQGIGAEVIELLTDFGFQVKQVDAIFGCSIADYNPRSRRAFEKNGYILLQENREADGMKAKFTYDYIMTRDRFFCRRTTMANDTQASLEHQYGTSHNLNARIALHQLYSTNPGFIPWLFAQLDLPATCRILEVGCGTGNLWVVNRAQIPAGWRLVLTDKSSAMVATTQSAVGELPQVEEIAPVDVQVIPYPSASFDAVIAIYMLNHAPDLDTALAEIHRVLKPGGTLYASTFGQRHMAEYFAALAPFTDAMAAHLDHNLARVTFSLENGADHLAPWFAQIELRRYEDALEVTDVEPLVAYVQSSRTSERPVLEGDALTQFRANITEQIAAHGAFHITKDTGIFVARKTK